jgi:hypothetical protein
MGPFLFIFSFVMLINIQASITYFFYKTECVNSRVTDCWAECMSHHNPSNTEEPYAMQAI